MYSNGFREEIDIIINEEYRAGQGAPRNKEE